VGESEALRARLGALHDDLTVLLPWGAGGRVTFMPHEEGLRVADIRFEVDPVQREKPDLGIDPASRTASLATTAVDVRALLRKEGLRWTGEAIELVRMARGRSMLRLMGARGAAHSYEIEADDPHALMNERLFDGIERAVLELERRGGALSREIQESLRGASWERESRTLTLDVGRKLTFPLHVLGAYVQSDATLRWAWAVPELAADAASIRLISAVREQARRLRLQALVAPQVWGETGLALALAKVAAWRGDAVAVFAAEGSGLVRFFALLGDGNQSAG
jgi:hypothetical protein